MSSLAIIKTNPAEERPIGIALLCDSQGNLRTILRDDSGFSASAQPGESFAAMVDHGSSEKAKRFVSHVNSNGAAYDWEMNLLSKGIVQRLHFAGDKTEEGILVVGASSRSGLSDIYEAAAGTQRRLVARPTIISADDAVCNELSRVNNELVNAQRELAKSLAQAQALQADMDRVHEELRTSRGELEQQVAKRTEELTVSLDALRSEVACRQQTEVQLRTLSARLLRLQDEERRRIARDLHDSTGQTLAALKMSVAALKDAVERHAPTAELFDDLNVLADQALSEIRTTSHLLHPPLLDEAGFVSAARWYVEGFAKRSRIQVELDIDAVGKIPSRIEMVLFRVLQESLTNVLRHSGATKAVVRLESGEDIVLSIIDYGKGIDSQTVDEFMQTGKGAGVGLAGMRERVRELGGFLEIRSGSSGTTVRAALPAD